MFGLEINENFKNKSEQRAKKATVIIAVVSVGIYIAFILLMLFTKLGILSLFVAAKPSVNMQSVSENPAYKCFDFDYYYKRFNWLFDGAYNKLYIIYEKDFDKLDSEFLTENSSVLDDLAAKYSLRRVDRSSTDNSDEATGGIMYTRFTSLGDGKHYFIGENTEITIPAGIEIFMPFGIFFLVFAAIKILILFKSYHDKKFEFDGKTGIVKISCIFEILGLAVITYVFFWMQINKVAIFANTVEPSLFYYLGFLLPLVFLNISFTFLYCSGADYEVSSIPVLHTQHSNVKHCQKCGAPINNSAALCEDCSGEKSAEQTEAAYTSPLPVRAYNHAIAKGRTLIIATGAAYIAVGIIMTVINTVFAEALDYVSPYVSILRIIIRVSANLGFSLSFYALVFITIIILVLEKFINIFFGIGILLKKQWAVLTVRIFMILGIVVNLFMILILLHPFQPLQAIFPLIFSLINIAYDIVMIFFTSSVVRTLSADVQNY